MVGKRNNISPLDEKILRLLYDTGEDRIDGYKSSEYVKKVFNESGPDIKKKLQRLEGFGLIMKHEKKKGSRTDRYWCITTSGRYCVLSRLKDHEEIRKFVEGSVKADDFKPDILISNIMWYPDNAVISDFIAKENWESIDELLDRIRVRVSKYQYKRIILEVKQWFKEFHGTLPSNLKDFPKDFF